MKNNESILYPDEIEKFRFMGYTAKQLVEIISYAKSKDFKLKEEEKTLEEKFEEANLRDRLISETYARIAKAHYKDKFDKLKVGWHMSGKSFNSIKQDLFGDE